ncbi:hypothetical protein RCH06_001719 [Polaromonas sp. CG_9.5]|uniref:DUF3829 domain-containing protein n=1 Tax=Polaromonas sp. CG_9.5 TaxID=3071705 RepID=UPI002DF7C3FA|nr:hypothetical protein [Polaromonas sp. CG_9.5]
MRPIRNTYRPALLGSLLASAVLLAACGKSGVETPAAGSNSSAPVVASAPAPAANAKPAGNTEQQASQKMNAYTDAYNKLIGTFGLPETYEGYLKDNIPKRTATDSISITDGWVEIALDKFKKGRALASGGQEALNQSADQLIGALDKLVVQLKALNIYYESKTYKNDNLARGKSEDASLRTHFEASMSAMKSFNEVLSQEQKKRNTEMLARLKASGDLLGYNSKLALGQGEELINLFHTESDIKSAAKYTEGDALVAELEKTLTAQLELYAAAKGKNPGPTPAMKAWPPIWCRWWALTAT